MHNSYFFLRKLSKELENRINGWTIGESFSQNRDELIIGVYNSEQQLYIKADLKEQFSCLSFSNEYSRARKNSVDLFQSIIGERIEQIYQYPNERAFAFRLQHGKSLIFKLFGNFSNIILHSGEQVAEVFKSKLKDDWLLDPEIWKHKMDLTEDNFLVDEEEPGKNFGFIDRNVFRHMEKIGFTAAQKKQKWDILQSTMTYLENPTFYIYESGTQIKFSLFEEENSIYESHDSIEAINQFYTLRQQKHWLQVEKQKYVSLLKKQVGKTINYIEKTSGKLKEIENSTDFRITADLIMANLHAIKEGNTEVKLANFYSGNTEIVKLNPRLSPQKNAENYYRKSKNRKVEIRNLQKNLDEKISLESKLKNQLEEIEKIEDIRSLRKYLEEEKLIKKDRKTNIDPPAFKEYEFQSFRILVGRNAKNNDQLTFNEGFKEDLWLHAKDVTGSHVLIKYKAGKPFPKPVIEKAASLAAYYSKNKNNSLVPVIYTPKKYVRKSKGLPAGAVLVDREEVIMVSPAESI